MKQKEVWLASLDPTVGAEIRKSRPCVIVSCDDIGVLPLKVVAPITDFKESFDEVPWMVKLIPNKLNGLSKPSVVDLFQVRSVSEQRLVKRLGVVEEKDFIKIGNALKIVFGF
jgi:mRNA interferase MazF